MTPEQKNIFRASYSILQAWKSGQWERAVQMYFKLETFTTEAMADGKTLHEKWEKHIIDTHTLPPEFGGKKLIDPHPEVKKVVHIYDWLDLVGVIDCYDNPIIYEFKSGKSASSEKYAASPQTAIYAVLATMPGHIILPDHDPIPTNGYFADRAEIHHYDQYSKTHDMSQIWITDEMLEKAFNWVVTVAGEMHAYFTDNNLYAQFGHNLKK